MIIVSTSLPRYYSLQSSSSSSQDFPRECSFSCGNSGARWPCPSAAPFTLRGWRPELSRSRRVVAALQAAQQTTDPERRREKGTAQHSVLLSSVPEQPSPCSQSPSLSTPLGHRPSKCDPQPCTSGSHCTSPHATLPPHPRAKPPVWESSLSPPAIPHLTLIGTDTS